MGTPRQIARRRIRKFLEERFAGHEIRWQETANSILIWIPGFDAPGYLPKGPSNGGNASVPTGYFKQLTRHFGVGEEAKEWLKKGGRSEGDGAGKIATDMALGLLAGDDAKQTDLGTVEEEG